eukprot:GHVU01116133.1.p2 GENE.GHVU01116133.1~~GHVU01116133.1.p2  ORF type:complete len:285 (+),score=26.78 GHVU01116133.1:326-1180(+)
MKQRNNAHMCIPTHTHAHARTNARTNARTHARTCFTRRTVVLLAATHTRDFSVSISCGSALKYNRNWLLKRSVAEVGVHSNRTQSPVIALALTLLSHCIVPSAADAPAAASKSRCCTYTLTVSPSSLHEYLSSVRRAGLRWEVEAELRVPVGLTGAAAVVVAVVAAEAEADAPLPAPPGSPEPRGDDDASFTPAWNGSRSAINWQEQGQTARGGAAAMHAGRQTDASFRSQPRCEAKWRRVRRKKPSQKRMKRNMGRGGGKAERRIATASKCPLAAIAGGCHHR